MEARPKGPSAFAAPGGKKQMVVEKSFKMEQVNIEVVKLQGRIQDFFWGGEGGGVHSSLALLQHQ